MCVGGRQPLVGSNDGDLHITLTSADDVTWPWKLGTAEKATKVREQITQFPAST